MLSNSDVNNGGTEPNVLGFGKFRPPRQLVLPHRCPDRKIYKFRQGFLYSVWLSTNRCRQEDNYRAYFYVDTNLCAEYGRKEGFLQCPIPQLPQLLIL
jgi:hypothetical protein